MHPLAIASLCFDLSKSPIVHSNAVQGALRKTLHKNFSHISWFISSYLFALNPAFFHNWTIEFTSFLLFYFFLGVQFLFVALNYDVHVLA